MPRVLVVASTFPASKSDPVPAFVRDQITAMKQAANSYDQYEFVVLAPHDRRSHTKSFTKHDDYDECRFHYFWPFAVEKLAGRGIMPAIKSNPLNYLLIPFLFVGEFFALWRLTVKRQPDVIYAHWFTPQAITSRWVSKLTRIPFVFTTHASDVAVWRKIPLGKQIVRRNVRCARAFTAVSWRSMAKLAQFFDEAEWKQLEPRSRIIPMGVDLPDNISDSIRAVDTPTILFVGRLVEKKGIQYLLPAFAKLLEDIPSARLTIAGDGPMRGELEKQAHELGVGDHTDFVGYISGQAKHDIMTRDAVFVVPSIATDQGDAEGLPVSLMEGLAYGKVCVATNDSGADGILTDSKDGYLIPQKDTAALATALRNALTLDQDKRQAIQTEARQTAQQFSWPDIARQHLDFLFEDKT